MRIVADGDEWNVASSKSKQYLFPLFAVKRVWFMARFNNFNDELI